MRTLKIAIAGLLLGAVAVCAGSAWAGEKWPAKPVRVIVPYPPGGAADTLARLMARQLQEQYKQAFVIENRGGAGGMIGSQMALHAEPDGYLLIVSSVGSHVGGPALQPNVYDPMKDFTHIAMLGGPPTALVVNPAQPIKSLPDFMAYARKMPDGLSWGSSGQGTHGSLIGQALQKITGLPMVEIRYKGGAESLADVVGNQVPVAFLTLSTGASNIRAGKLRVLAVTSSKRIPDFPDVPTFTELGYPQLAGTAWYAISGPAGMPPALVEQINHDVRQAMSSPEGKAELLKQNMESQDWDAATFTKYVQSEIDHWSGYFNKPEGK
ncbi:tripartite tricarboxylate transporter substrate binding protein [Pigmentiphaga soli]|uniref:Tripartite tricarboxylate transporter substrate binding protein n=1 Tax=Pigmentiphaga soli TaxID=1007095 RepID=A0ABP8H976_9BURK